MKLRNKMTGDLGDLQISQKHIVVTVGNGSSEVSMSIYKSLNELNKEWEDYAPKEPLIKDEKIRKVVRAWAKVNRDVNEVIYKYDTNTPYCEIVDNQSAAKIRFNFLFIKELNTYELYTITELCGEEKKC